jgi:leader peptidase (prepilin peptidase)/N-methyltransferase
MEYFFYFLTFVIGLLLGSFFNVCIYRIPREESIVFPASHCTNCSTKLKWKDLIPVFSFLVLGGRCRYCGEKISLKYPLVELATSLIYLILAVMFGMSSTFFIYAFLCSLLIIATVIDLEFQIIPNGLVIIGIVAGFIFSLLGLSVPLVDALIGMLVGGGIFLLVALLAQLILKREGIGGGDIKFMAMIGLFIGWRLTILSILLSIYSGGLIGGLLLLFGIKKRSDAIPYGPFIALGTFLSILYGNDLINWYVQTFFW